jgi:hypothetical protein
LSTTKRRPLPSPGLTTASGLPGIAVTGSTLTVTAAGSNRDAVTVGPGVGPADAAGLAVVTGRLLAGAGVGDEEDPQVAVTTVINNHARVRRRAGTTAS